MKAIVTSLGMIVFVAAVVVGGTGAFFNDTETSTANVFTAGALDLKIDSVAHINGLVCFDGAWASEEAVTWNSLTSQLEVTGDVEVENAAYNAEFPSNVPQAGDECAGTWALTDLGVTNKFFDYGDLKPGDNGENTISIHVNNNDAYLCAIVNNLQSNDNTQTEPESEVDANGTTTGELHQELRFFVWEDDGDNIYESLTESQGVLVTNGTVEAFGGVYPLYTPTSGAFTGGTTQYLGVAWCYGTFDVNGSCDGAPVGNISQTDSLSADISFYIEQARNNPNFTCPSLNN